MSYAYVVDGDIVINTVDVTELGAKRNAMMADLGLDSCYCGAKDIDALFNELPGEIKQVDVAPATVQVKDMFAAAALTALVTRGDDDDPDKVANRAWMYADAMMEERE